MWPPTAVHGCTELPLKPSLCRSWVCGSQHTWQLDWRGMRCDDSINSACLDLRPAMMDVTKVLARCMLLCAVFATVGWAAQPPAIPASHAFQLIHLLAARRLAGHAPFTPLPHNIPGASTHALRTGNLPSAHNPNMQHVDTAGACVPLHSALLTLLFCAVLAPLLSRG